MTEPVTVPSTCAIDVAGEGETVRVFAVGPVIRYREMLTYADFCTAWDDVVRTEVLPCLAADKPNLLVFPENAALSAAFIGTRATQARAITDTLASFLSFFDTYIEPFEFYGNRFTELSINQGLVLSLTDTLHRAFQTFPEIARQYEVHVAVSSDFAPAEETSEPAIVERLKDPDLESVESVWVATEPAAFNWGILFGPDGQETDRIAKTYLVPDEEDLLDLTHESLLNVRPLQSPFARIGMVISKDAWMPDVLQRLDLLSANLMLQPEAFAGWGVEEFSGDWLPDIVRQSSWGHTQKHQAFRHNVTPCIKGNLLGLVFDCQSHITKVASDDDTPRAFIGQDNYTGLLAVEPWVIADPGPPLSLEARREMLRDRAERMLPNSGDPFEDAYEGRVIAADLTLATDGRVAPTGDGEPGTLGASAVLAEALEPTHHQRFVSLAAAGSFVLAAFMEGPVGDERIRAFWSNDEGASFSGISLPDAEGTQRAPRVAVSTTAGLIAWEEDTAAGAEVVVAVALEDGMWSTRRLTDAAVAPAWQPDPAVDPLGDGLYVTWLDFRAGGHPKPWLARSTDGASWTETQVDPANTVIDNPRGNAAFVRVAALDGAVHVAFTDFREFSWDVYLASSADSGASFAPATRINPPAMTVTRVFDGAEVESERLHADVALALGPSGQPWVAWTERQDRRYESRIALYSPSGIVRVDDAPAGIDAWRPSLIVPNDSVALLAWQDLRQVTNGVRARSIGGASIGSSVVIDDTDRLGHAYSPQIATAGEALVFVWEDPRSGYSRIRMARGAAIFASDSK